MLRPIVSVCILSITIVAVLKLWGKNKMKKNEFIGSDIPLSRKNIDEYVAYLEHKMLTELECQRCVECERMVTDNDVIKFETGDYCCPDCSSKHTRRLEHEFNLLESIQEAAEEAYRNR